MAWGAVSQQAIIWLNIDPNVWHLMLSLGHNVNELLYSPYLTHWPLGDLNDLLAE